MFTHMMIIDAHSHLQLPEYDADRDSVIVRMKTAGVGTITVGVDEVTSRAALALAEAHPDFLWATVGTHPADGGLDIFNADVLRELAAHPKAVAIGECGLDYYRLKSGAEAEVIKMKQKEVFRAHIKVAEEVRKPLMIHCRPTKGTDDAYDDLSAILSERALTVPVVIHFFVGSAETARQLVALGCYFTFGGVLTFTGDYDVAIAGIPLDRIMAETDAPFVAPVPYRGTRNEPAYVTEVVRRLGELKGVGYEDMSEHVTRTARAVFAI